MRPYRGKTYDGEWVYGYLVEGENSYIITEDLFYSAVVTMPNCLGESHMSTSCYHVDPDTVGQYVTTYNNQEIYEDDIIKDEGEKLFEIKFGEYIYENGDIQIHTVGFYTVVSDEKEIWNFPFYLEKGDKIIGNTIDNPELLKDV
ncbi:MAG: YopX family protein [bacterium]